MNQRESQLDGLKSRDTNLNEPIAGLESLKTGKRFVAGVIQAKLFGGPVPDPLQERLAERQREVDFAERRLAEAKKALANTDSLVKDFVPWSMETGR